MPKRKLLHIITSLDTGGAEMSLLSLLRELSKGEFECEVVSLVEPGVVSKEIESLGIRVHSLDLRKSLASFFSLRRLNAIVRDFDPDAIQCWMYHANILASILSLCYGWKTPLYWNIRHSADYLANEKRLTRWLIVYGRLLSHRANAIIFNSYRSRDQHVELGYRNDNILVVPNGVNCELYQPTMDKRVQLRRSLGIELEAPVIGIVGRYHPIKDQRTFLKSAIELHQHRPDVHFLLVGRGLANHQEFSNMVKASSQHSKFHFLDEQKDLSQIYNAIDIFTLTSKSESFPNVLCEAMACASIAVSTDAGDAAKIIGDDQRIFSPGAYIEIAREWERLLSMDKLDLRESKQECRDRMVELFSLENSAARYRTLYQGLRPSEP